ncbi:MAG: MBL fold metallo-hydrolase [Treponema sp.]|jgi:glyoxylase-like metal-dependent hydrolase (beta-lactamase superfamily II)|nr:MBL fold metallo-hydrolase [Treponema sp.]
MIESLVVGPFAANCWIYAREVPSKEPGDCVVIDPGADAEIIISRLERLKLRPRYILLTHGHFDHIAALPALAKAYQDSRPTIAIHRSDAAYLGVGALRIHRESFAAAAGNAAYVDAFSSDMPEADTLLDEGSVIGPFRVLHLPGHTPGSAAFYDQDAKILFTGDTLFRSGYGRTDLPGGSLPQLRQSLQRLSAMDRDTGVYPGHEGTTTIGKEFNRGL